MNKDKLKSIISKKAKSNSNLSAQLYQMYFFEHILDRISKSKYKNNIILKGGLLLSSIIGADDRTTNDMDTTLKGIPLTKNNVRDIINEILAININDNIFFEIVDIRDIRKDDKYGGFKINLLAKMDTLKVYLAIELTTGDIITPKEIEYKYISHFDNRKIYILAYNLESVIAEKYQTIIDRDIYNTRMKDFYDIYILITENKDKINFKDLCLAIRNTFKNRNTELNIEKIKNQLDNMRINNKLISLWKNYQIHSTYSSNINYQDLYNSLEYITDVLDKDKIFM